MDFLKYSNLLTPGNILLVLIGGFALFVIIKTVRAILRIISLMIFLFSSFLFYSTKIEPYQLKIYNHDLTVGSTQNSSENFADVGRIELNQKYAVVSDLHLGHWKKEAWTLKIVNEINKTDVDAVLFAGDWVSWPITQGVLERSLSPLQYLNKPAFAVLGNHDNGVPGYSPFRENIIKELEKNKVQVIENQVKTLNGVNIIGIADYYSGLDDLKVLEGFDEAMLKKSVVLTHDPEIIYSYPKDINVLTISGHTHCGQMNIPYYKYWVSPTKHKFKNDYQMVQAANDNEVFVTCGAGETLIPIRFLTPPRIDVLNI